MSKMNTVPAKQTNGGELPETLDIYRTINEKQLAQLLGKCVATLRNERWRKEGVPYIRIGKRSIRYRMKDVLAYLDEQAKKS